MKEDIYIFLKEQALEKRNISNFTASRVASSLRLQSEDIPMVYEILNQLSEEKDEILKTRQQGGDGAYSNFSFRFAKEIYVEK